MSDKKDINDTTVKLYIGGIDPDWSSDKIKDILAKHGDVIRVDVVKNFAFAVSSQLPQCSQQAQDDKLFS